MSAGTPMSSNALDGRSVVLRLEFSIADAVRQKGLLSVIGSAIGAWWAMRPVRYSDVPPHLRADVGLPTENERRTYLGLPLDAWRFHPPERRWP